MTSRRACGICGGIHDRGEACPHKPARPRRRTRAVAVRSSARWKRLEPRIIARDGHQCTWGLEKGDRGARHYAGSRCPVRSGLQAHHRVPIEAGGEPFDEANLRTLCATHHARADAALRRP